MTVLEVCFPSSSLLLMIPATEQGSRLPRGVGFPCVGQVVGRKEGILPLYGVSFRALRFDCLKEQQERVCFGCGLGPHLHTNIPLPYPHALAAGLGCVEEPMNMSHLQL